MLEITELMITTTAVLIFMTIITIAISISRHDNNINILMNKT